MLAYVYLYLSSYCFNALKACTYLKLKIAILMHNKLINNGVTDFSTGVIVWL